MKVAKNILFASFCAMLSTGTSWAAKAETTFLNQFTEEFDSAAFNYASHFREFISNSYGQGTMIEFLLCSDVKHYLVDKNSIFIDALLKVLPHGKTSAMKEGAIFICRKLTSRNIPSTTAVEASDVEESEFSELYSLILLAVHEHMQKFLSIPENYALAKERLNPLIQNKYFNFSEKTTLALLEIASTNEDVQNFIKTHTAPYFPLRTDSRFY